MNRRRFLRLMTGAGAGLAVAPLLPSEVWPFRKIFLPSVSPFSDFWRRAFKMYDDSPTVAVRLANIQEIAAIELESFANEIPQLVSKESALFKLFLRSGVPIFSPAGRPRCGALDLPEHPDDHPAWYVKQIMKDERT